MAIKQIITSFYYYLPAYIFGSIALFASINKGSSFFFLPIFAFVVIPIFELILKPNKGFVKVSNTKLNSLLTILVVPFHYYIVFIYLKLFSEDILSLFEVSGACFSLGILCGVYGINVAHELGHRKEKWKQYLAQSLLLTSLYMHFFIEHNRGHHKKVATPFDPATARRNESVYLFWFRCIKNSFLSAFDLEKTRLKKLQISWLSINNQFLRFILIQVLFLVSTAAFLSLKTLFLFIISAVIGILLLETINYIEHYGLLRKELATNVYEKVNETHSWNSDHILGRYLLFELTRHSHHHQNEQREYFELESMPKSSQLPTGYPGMILLSLVPPLFFRVMNKRLCA
jgi:alkane 1-monooxygenase